MRIGIARIGSRSHSGPDADREDLVRPWLEAWNHRRDLEFVLYHNSEPLFPSIRLHNPEVVRWHNLDFSHEETITDRLQRLIDRNPDRLDALLLLDSFRVDSPSSVPPARPIQPLTIAAVVLARDLEFERAEPYTADDRPGLMRESLKRINSYDVLIVLNANELDFPSGRKRLQSRIIRICDSKDRPSGSDLAERVLRAIETPAHPKSTRKPRTFRRQRSRPRLAVFSPWPPKGSGISDYSLRLIEELRSYYHIELYHEPGYVPEIGLSSREIGCFDYRVFSRREKVLGPYRILYQVGNSFYHGFIYEYLARYPGVVTLHDYCLSGLQFWRAHQGGDPFENLREMVRRHYPARFEEFDPQLRSWTEEPGGFAEALSRRGLAVNREVFQYGMAVIVHSPWCLKRSRHDVPEYSDKTVVIPHGATVLPVTPEDRREARDRFGLPREAFIIASFGILSYGKMNREAIMAFHALAIKKPNALFLFVGQDWDRGAAREKAEELGLAGRVRFLGRQSAESFEALLKVPDLGVSLRRPPTYGETSGALLHLLRCGIPTIVTDVGTFSDYPDSVVRKVPWDSSGVDRLAEAICQLATDGATREALGRSAYEYVAREHSWSRVAERYAEILERCACVVSKERVFGAGALVTREN